MLPACMRLSLPHIKHTRHTDTQTYMQYTRCTIKPTADWSQWKPLYTAAHFTAVLLRPVTLSALVVWISWLSCSHLARRWVVLERRSAWSVVDTQVKTCSRETHSPSRASETYGHNAFQIIHIHTTVINGGRAHTTQHCTHWGLWLRLQSWLMPQSPHCLRNDLKCGRVGRYTLLNQSINLLAVVETRFFFVLRPAVVPRRHSVLWLSVSAWSYTTEYSERDVLQSTCRNFCKVRTSVQLGTQMNWLDYEVKGQRSRSRRDLIRYSKMHISDEGIYIRVDSLQSEII